MKKQRILYVDDMEEVHKKVKENYKNIEFDFVTTEKEALEKLEKNQYDKVISDYDLGDGSTGLEIIRKAKAKGLTTIMASRENHSKEALKAGADEFIFKKRLFEDYII